MLINLKFLNDRDGTFFQSKGKACLQTWKLKTEPAHMEHREAHYYKVFQDRGYPSITQYTIYAGIF